MPQKDKTIKKYTKINKETNKETKEIKVSKEYNEQFFNLPNIISLSRLPLLLAIVYLLLINFNLLLSATLIIFLFLLDILDGYVARKTGKTTKLGEKVDELVDRIIELSFFILFAYLQYIPAWAPIIMILRAFIVDGIVLSHKTSNPDSIKSKGYLSLIRSDWSRVGYGFLKMLLFVGLVFYPTIPQIYQQALFILTVLVVLFSLFRGYIKIREYFP